MPLPLALLSPAQLLSSALCPSYTFVQVSVGGREHKVWDVGTARGGQRRPCASPSRSRNSFRRTLFHTGEIPCLVPLRGVGFGITPALQREVGRYITRIANSLAATQLM